MKKQEKFRKKSDFFKISSKHGVGTCRRIHFSRTFDYNYQNALRQVIVFSIVFFCEESLMRDTNLHNKDCSEMHSGSCSQMTSSCKCPVS